MPVVAAYDAYGCSLRCLWLQPMASTVAAHGIYGCSPWHLRLQAERHTLTDVLSRSHREISITFETATTDALRTVVTMGCRALHYSGHGEEALEPYPYP
eukprot:scaffold26336_cov63-Phaeocystis_antarctica.AAC.2